MMQATAAANIDVMQRAFGFLNARDLEACMSLMTPDFVINIAGMPYQKRGLKVWKQHAETLFAAFPDVKVEVEDIFAADDKLAVRVRITGTHRGEFLGNAPSGKPIDYKSHEVYRFEDGKLAEEWICSDALTLMTQVGAFSKGRLVSMWLASFRLWFGFAAGIAVGILAFMLI